MPKVRHFRKNFPGISAVNYYYNDVERSLAVPESSVMTLRFSVKALSEIGERYFLTCFLEEHKARDILENVQLLISSKNDLKKI